MGYDKPSITEVGSVADLTLHGRGNGWRNSNGRGNKGGNGRGPGGGVS